AHERGGVLRDLLHEIAQPPILRARVALRRRVSVQCGSPLPPAPPPRGTQRRSKPPGGPPADRAAPPAKTRRARTETRRRRSPPAPSRPRRRRRVPPCQCSLSLFSVVQLLRRLFAEHPPPHRRRDPVRRHRGYGAQTGDQTAPHQPLDQSALLHARSLP